MLTDELKQNLSDHFCNFSSYFVYFPFWNVNTVLVSRALVTALKLDALYVCFSVVAKNQ